MYDCGEHRYEDFHSVAECDEDHFCECGREAHRVPCTIPTVGAMPSKPVRLGGADIEFTDNASLRAYQRENPDVRFVSKDSSWYKNHMDNNRESVERSVKRLGWRDLDQKRAADIEAKKQGKRCAKAPITT